MIIDLFYLMIYILNMFSLLVKIPKDLHRRFKSHCYSIEKTMKGVIIELIEKELENNKD